MAKAVDRGRIDPIDALVERRVDRRNRLAIFLRPPVEFPAGAADGPRAKADCCQPWPVRAELSLFH
jgi:hypothetical protein